jgi:Caspase domain
MMTYRRRRVSPELFDGRSTGRRRHQAGSDDVARPVLTTLCAVLLICLICACLAVPATAELNPAGKRVALVIGNSGYRNVDHLPNAANDAKLMAETLRSLGFSIVGGAARLDLDRQQLSDAVHDFGAALAGAEVGLFYYSGHGLQVKGVNWLVPIDASPASERDLDFQMVDADLVLRQMDGIGTKLNIVLLDACRNNPFAQRGLRALQGGLAEMRAPEGTLISYATQPGNVAVDGAGSNSPYTEALSNAMHQPGLDIFRLFNQVGLQVKKTTEGRQQPWVSTSPIDGDFYFAGLTTASPALPAMVKGPSSATPTATPPTATPPAATPTATPPTATPPTATPPVATTVSKAPVAADASPPAPPATAAGRLSTVPTQTGTTAPAPNPTLAGATSPPTVPTIGGVTNPPPAAPPAPMPLTTAMAVPPSRPPVSDADTVVRGLVQGQTCAILDTRKEDNDVRVVGLARAGPRWDDLVRQLHATRAIHFGPPQVAFLPEFACPVVDLIGPLVRQTRAAEPLFQSPPEIISDTALKIALRVPKGQVLRLDLYRQGEVVEHLFHHFERREGDVAWLVAVARKPLTGERLLAVIAPPALLGLAGRPAEEPSGPFLAALGDVLKTAPDGVRADVALLEARPPAPVANPERPRPAPVSPVVARPGGRPARCGAILQRAQLGEGMSESDRAFMREACR